MQLPADLSRCVGTTCAKRDRCARYRDVIVPERYVPLSFTDFAPYIVDGACPYFTEFQE